MYGLRVVREIARINGKKDRLFFNRDVSTDPQYHVEVQIKNTGKHYSADVRVRIAKQRYVRSFDLSLKKSSRRVVRRLVMRELRTEEITNLTDNWLTIDYMVDPL